jgi:hypothetical protein
MGTLADIYYNTTTKTWEPLVQECTCKSLTSGGIVVTVVEKLPRY